MDGWTVIGNMVPSGFMCVFKRKSFTVIEASKQKIYGAAVHLKTVDKS